MVTWVWKSWAGHKRGVEASKVEFTANYVLFFGEAGQLILAVREYDCADLHPEPEGYPAWWMA